MKYLIFSLLLIFYQSSTVIAQNIETSHELSGRIVDFVTNESVSDSTEVVLLSEDSTLVGHADVFNISDFYKSITRFSVRLKQKGNYILRVSNPQYYTLYKPIHVKLYKREKIIDVGILPLKRKYREKIFDMNEVEVTATKLKFYFSKDTLIYNADMFITQKGFVLNEILKKMPGLEVRDNGEIFSNGRKVDALLLNGKDFFNNDRKTLLENLPAYAVKQVKIFDKSKDSLSLIRREREFEGLVMDIRLKREYETSSFANVDLGYGTDHRYYGKLVGLKFNSLFRISAFCFANNVNKTELPTGMGDSYGIVNSNGNWMLDKAGLAYNLDNSKGLYSLNGNIQAEYIDGDDVLNTVKRQFYSSGDVYSRSNSVSNQYMFRFSTSHVFDLLGNTVYSFKLTPSFTYEKSKMNSENYTASTTIDLDDYWKDGWTDSLKTMDGSDVLNKYGIYDEMNLQKNVVDNLDFKIEFDKSMKIPHSNDIASISGFYNYISNTCDEFSQRNIEYLRLQNNQYVNIFSKKTSYIKECRANADYSFVFNQYGNLRFGYHFNFKSVDNDNPIYALQNLFGWDSVNGNPIGILPSEKIMVNLIDKNSYSYTQKNNDHMLNIMYELNRDWHFNKLSTTINVPINMQRRQMKYFRPSYEQNVSQSAFLPNFNLNFNYTYSNHEKRRFYYCSFAYDLRSELPSLYNLVNVTNDINPLYISHGNADLKNARNQHFFAQSFFQTPLGDVYRANITYDIYGNQVAYSQLYDVRTGITNITPINVNGNNTLSFELVNEKYLERSKRNKLTNTFRVIRNNSVDMMRTTLDNLSELSRVINNTYSESITYNFISKNNKISMTGVAFLQYSRSRGNRNSFIAQKYYDFGLNYSLKLELPKDFRVETNWNTTFRRGLSYSEMNTTESIWNATLTKAINEKIILSIEGFDILGQMKLMKREINAQSMVETYYNALRRYVMFHAVFHLSKKRVEQNLHHHHM